MTPEGKVKKDIDKLLKKFCAYYFKPVQNGMGRPGLDYHAVIGGIPLFIEAKAPGKKPTPRQLQTMKEIQQAGGDVFVCDGNLDELEEYIVSLLVVHETAPKIL